MDVINYTPLLVVFAIAWAVPFLLSWLEISKFPAVIASIIMGVIVGPYVLDWVDSTPYMDFLSKTGFLFLIFLSGLEIDIGKIAASMPKGKVRGIDLISNSLILAIVIYFGSLILSLPFAWLVSLFIEIDIMFFTLLLPTVALSITVPILKADGELTRKFKNILGKDATTLFDKYHRWVNIDGLIGPLLLGTVAAKPVENPFSVIPPKESHLSNAPRVSTQAASGTSLLSRPESDDDEEEQILPLA